MSETVLLFDIDGTLVATGGAGRRAMVAAFADLYANDHVFDGLSFAGMTDRAIARHGVVAAAAACDEAAIDRALDAYVAHLHRELTKADGYRVFPGVNAVLQRVRAQAGIAVGLGTGNVKRGAYAKLAPGDLGAHFAFGGFGCDAEARTEVLRSGARRGAEALGVPLDACRVVVVGDTPKDVAAAKGIGAECVAVGTGGFAPASLVELGATHAFATLEDDGVLDVLLREVPSSGR
jgi:phosphoglycolate phosphatase-like HAD superfamily hydrolase